MVTMRPELVNAVVNRAYALTDINIHDNDDKQHDFRKRTILVDESLTKDEKSVALKQLNKFYDFNKISFNKGTKRICENCHNKCLATTYCEICIQNYLKSNFSNWTSGSNDIDNLIHK